ncbi:MAG TPA: malto-oligosyltrehalose trehalohydrolase [Candidatus Omnitrophota bacterium]|nr:malto-oligosyltrehalose trehalohydrolase [Candidatus Omnitrophota bacterium]HQO58186.1 malto-oligosyltrehalose trehalohydrolase [Candidatus Omnitrophota bacterium]
MDIGALYQGAGRCLFRVWAPQRSCVSVLLTAPEEEIIPMAQEDQGYWAVTVDGVSPGACYKYLLNQDQAWPDPASFYQPQGVHGPSAVWDHAGFPWHDAGWRPVPLQEMLIYELHIGAFSEEGTFDGALYHLPHLLNLGINAVEIMPVAPFPGERNWGYDGVYPFAVQSSYGGPDGLKRFVDACHARGLAVILDVVYNHLGPEGNYLGQFGPYFTGRYQTPWGEAVNFDGEYSDGVRNYFVRNALYWFREFHVDALRLDAVHGIYDRSAKPILREIREHVDAFSARAGRTFYLIAESDLNDVRLVTDMGSHGCGMHAQWCDDFHHALHALVTGEAAGYYGDFGHPEDLRKAYQEGFVYSWKYSAFRKQYFGSSSRDIPGDKFVVFTQNHDQVGNRMKGERLCHMASFEASKLAAGAVCAAPYIPLFFMGEEYAEEAPFQYFVSHSDEGLIRAVREGRQKEFAAFPWQDEVPDPQSEDTFVRSRLRWDTVATGGHAVMFRFYQRLIQLRKTVPALRACDKNAVSVFCIAGRVFQLVRSSRESRVVCFMNFSAREERVSPKEVGGGLFYKRLDSSEAVWQGPGSLAADTLAAGHEPMVLRPWQFVLYERRKKGEKMQEVSS